MDGVYVLAWIIGLVLSIFFFVAQMQLFSIKKDLRALRLHFLGVQETQQPAAGGSVVSVKSKPSGAEIYVDGQKLGETPFQFMLLRKPDGAERIITLRMSGYQDHEERFRPDGSPIDMSASLKTGPRP